MAKYIQLPDDRYVCGPHRLVICSICDVDFSVFNQLVTQPPDMLESMINDLEPSFAESLTRAIQVLNEGSSVAPPRRATPPLDTKPLAAPPSDSSWNQPGTEPPIPGVFLVPTLNSTPFDIFSSINIPYTDRTTRFVHREDPLQLLVFAGSAYVYPRSENPRAGWAFWFRFDTAGHGYSIASGRLEDKDSEGNPLLKTKDSADIRALIAILQRRRWAAEGFTTLVIATSSHFVVDTITIMLRPWCSYNWQPPSGVVPPNRDLWEIFLAEVDKCNQEGLDVKVWQVLKTMTEQADLEAVRVAMN
ncbi:hypothetical protein F4781DRAFT_285173 [Annulohypoxylon bovei var. microspora]|nr:hypothetical protein F4781DRAFT_285173 [Annulohypoxylon bovei var. microspora]